MGHPTVGLVEEYRPLGCRDEGTGASLRLTFPERRLLLDLTSEPNLEI